MEKLNTKYKDGIFRQLFNDKDHIRELYSALADKDYSSAEVDIVTLENAIFGDVKNDLAFIIDNKFIVLTEHQSTINPNMPFRMAVYLMKEYERLYFNKRLYSTRLVKVPRPELYVFYNGNQEQPLYQELKFSDSFTATCDKIALELVVKVINVNYEKGAEILSKCKTLSEYSMFISSIKHKIREENDLQQAIETSIRECIEKNILREFLQRNGGHVVSFLYQALTSEEIAEIRAADAAAEAAEKAAAEAKKIGIEEGIIKERKKIAEKLHAAGKSIDDIAEFIEVPTEEVEQLLED